MSRLLWVDAACGVAGDMLLAALIDAGAPLAVVQAAVDAVSPATALLAVEPVTRHGMRALHVRVRAQRQAVAHRPWATIRDLLRAAELAGPVRRHALDTFESLARAEAHVHGVPVDEVVFHEVGSWDSIADVVGVAAALHSLEVTRVHVGPIALGSGEVEIAHGRTGVPVPAVAHLAAGRVVQAGPGSGELATPTGMALLAGAVQSPGIPPMRVDSTGAGAGSRDPASHANVLRVTVGRPADEPDGSDTRYLLECNVDDLDPRLWPGVLDALLAAGADDAWLTPVIMKQGRPAHTLGVLTADPHSSAERVLALTSTLGVRWSPVRRRVLERTWVSVATAAGPVRIKLGLSGERIVNAEPEFRDVRELAGRTGTPERDLLRAAQAAAQAAGLAPGWRRPTSA